MIGHNPVVETLKIFDTNKEKPLEFLHTRSFININAATGWAVSSGGKFPYENKIRLPISDDDFPVTLEYQPHAIIQPNAVESCAPSNFPYIETTGINEVTLYAFSIPSPTTMLPIVVNLTQTGSPYGATNASAARSSVEQTAIQLSQNYFVVETQNDLLKKEEVINYVITAYKGGEMIKISAPSESPANWIFQQDGTPIAGTNIVISESLDDYSINVTLTLPQGTLIRNGVAVVYFPINAGGVFYPRATVNTTEASEIIDQVESYEIETSDLSRSSNNTYFVNGVPLSGSGSGLRVTTNKKTINGVVTTAAGELRFYSSGGTLRHTQATSGNALITLPNLEKFNNDNSIDMVFYIGGQEVAREMLLISSAGYSVILQTTSEYIIPEATREIGVASFYLLESQAVVRKTGTIRIYQNEVKEETLLKEASGVSELSYSLMDGDDFVSLDGYDRIIITFTDIDGVLKAQRTIPVVGMGDIDSTIWSLTTTPSVLIVETDMDFNTRPGTQTQSRIAIYRDGLDVTSDFELALELTEQETAGFEYSLVNNVITITDFRSESGHIGFIITGTHTENTEIRVIGSMQAIRRSPDEALRYYTHIMYTDDPDELDLEKSPLSSTTGQYLGVAVTLTENPPGDKESYKWTLSSQSVRVVEGSKTEYRLSESGTVTPEDNGWSTRIPELEQGHYLWTRVTIYFSDDTESRSYSVSYIAIDGEESYRVEFFSETGFVYEKGSNMNVVIEARVMQGNRNATQDNLLGFEWTRISGNREADERFNNQGRSGNRLTLRKKDLGDGATYQCDVYFLNQKGLLSSTSESIQVEQPDGWVVGDEINGVPIDKSRNYILGSDEVKELNQSLSTVDNDFTDWIPAPEDFPTKGILYQLSQPLQTNIDYKLILDSPIDDSIYVWGNNYHALAILEPNQVEVTINSEVEGLDILILTSLKETGSINKIALTQWASEFEGTLDLSKNTIELTPDPSGEEGTVQYVHIRYSSDANGGQMTYGLEDDTAYIGLLNSMSLFGSENSADYSWSPLSGSDQLEAIPSPEEWPGTYTWVKYADTPTTGMSDYPDTKTYIGLASNKTTETESLEYEDYEWSLIPQSIEIRGKNLLRSSGVEVSNGTYNIASYDLTDDIKENEEVTLTIWGELASTKTNFRAYNSGGSVSLATLTDNGDGTYSSTFEWTIGSSTNTYLSVYAFTNAQTGISTINKIKLEKGNTATDWTPAPEDFIYWSLAPEEQPLNLEVSELGDHWLTGQTVVTVDSEKESAQNVIAVREEISRNTQIINDVEGRLTINLTQVTSSIETIQDELTDTDDNIRDIITKQVEHQNSIDATAEWQKTTLSRVDGQDQEISVLKQTAQSWEQSFKKSGGANLIKNSVGFKGTNFWTTMGTVTVINSSETASGKAFQLGGSTNNWIRQKVDLMNNEEYSINMLVSAITASVVFRGVKLLYKENGVNKEEILLDFPGSGPSNGVFNGTFSKNFTTGVWTDTEIMIANNVVSGSSIFGVADFGLYRGHNSVGWQQHAGESYTSFVQMDIDGLTVYGKTEKDGVESVDESTRTVMSPHSFAGYFADQKIFELSQYDTRVESLVVGQRGIHISPIKMIPNKERKSIVEVWTGFVDGDVL